MAFIRGNIRLAAVFLLSLPVSGAMGVAGAHPRMTPFRAVTQKEESANPPQMERLLVALAGEWTTEDIYEASDRASRPRLEHAREDFRVGPARLSLIEEYHGEDSAGKAWGTGTFWWDAKAQGVHVLWCASDATDSGCRVLSGIGGWEGNNFVQTDVTSAHGKQVFGREVWSDLKRDSFTQTVYKGAAADKLEKVLTIRATRKQ